MPAWLSNIINRLRTSLWLIPTCMALAAFLLSLAVPYLDVEFSPKNIQALRWLSNMGPEGAMTLLSTIAGSMITIAGVVFSITIVALALASSQFGPRLLNNFLRDRGNQVVLGTFVATFLYCLLVLRTIHFNESVETTPYWGTLLGLILAICSLGVFIYFMHHIAISIQAPHLIAVVTDEMEEAMTRLFPERLGQGADEVENHDDALRMLKRLEKEGVPVHADTGGYIQAIESSRLMEIAREHQLTLLLQYRPGHFLIKDMPLGKVLGMDPLSPDVAKEINRQFFCGPERTQEQDLEFAVLQLVEVAVRALSPGVNDPFTCIQCLDHLSSMLCQLAQRKLPSPYRYDPDGTLRIIASTVSFTGIFNAAFQQIRQHGIGDVAVMARMAEGLARIASCAERPEDRQTIRRHVEMIRRGCAESIPEKLDLEAVEIRCDAVLTVLGQTEQGRSR